MGSIINMVGTSQEKKSKTFPQVQITFNQRTPPPPPAYCISAQTNKSCIAFSVQISNFFPKQAFLILQTWEKGMWDIKRLIRQKRYNRFGLQLV